MPDILRPHLDTDKFSDTADLLDLVGWRPAWMADATCREAPPDVTWFPVLGQSAQPAKRICSGCLCLAECRAWSLAQGPELDGVWAGLTRLERRAIRAGRHAA